MNILKTNFLMPKYSTIYHLHFMAHRSGYLHVVVFNEMCVLEFQSKLLSSGFLIIKIIVAK